MKEFNLSDRRKKLFDQLWIDLQEGNLTLRDIFNDCVEVHKDLDKEFIKKLKEGIQEVQNHHDNYVLKESDIDFVHEFIDKLAGKQLTGGQEDEKGKIK